MALNTSRGKGSPTLVSSCPCSHGSQGCSGREEDCYRKSFPCPHSKGSTSFEDGGRTGSICPAAPRRVPKLQDPPGIPPLPTALPCSPPLSSLLLGLAPSIIHAPRCRQPVHAGLLPSAFKPALAGKLQPPSWPASPSAGHGEPLGEQLVFPRRRSSFLRRFQALLSHRH